MGAKKKGKKKGAGDKPKKVVEIIKPNFVPPNLESLPIIIKIKHKKDIYCFYSDEYSYSIEIKKQLSLLNGIPVESMKLYLDNKRHVEDESTNHDQQIDNKTVMYACYKNEDDNKFEDIKTVINYVPEEADPDAEEQMGNEGEVQRDGSKRSTHRSQKN